MIITISGKAGSGKTTVGKIVAKKLGYDFFSIGDIRGKVAEEKGLTIDELNEIGKTEDWTDKVVDEYQSKMGKEKDNFVIDGWISYNFIPHSFKVFLDIEIDESAKRIFIDQRPDEEKKENASEVKKMILQRMDQSKERYIKYYGTNPYELSHYDLVIDTTSLDINGVVDKIYNSIKGKL